MKAGVRIGARAGDADANEVQGMSDFRRSVANARPAIITVGVITAVQGFVATLVTDGPTAPAIMLVGLIAIALALVPGARSPGT